MNEFLTQKQWVVFFVVQFKNLVSYVYFSTLLILKLVKKVKECGRDRCKSNAVCRNMEIRTAGSSKTKKIQRNVQKSVMHLQSCCFANIGASSLEPGFRDLAFTSKSSVKFSMRSYDMAGWLGSRDLAKRAGNFAIRTLQPGYRGENWMNCGGSNGIVLHCLLYFPHHISELPKLW